MSWSPATSRVRRHIEHRGFDAQKQWVISYSPWVALAIVFPQTPAQMFDPWRSLSFAGLCQIAAAWSPKTDKWFLFLVTPLKKQQGAHCQAEQESSSSFPLPLLSLNQIRKWLILMHGWASKCLNTFTNPLTNLSIGLKLWTTRTWTWGSSSSLGLVWRMCRACEAPSQIQSDAELSGPSHTASGAEGLAIHAPWTHHYLLCCRH